MTYQASFAHGTAHQQQVDAVPGGSTVLEVGCASGYIASALAAKGCTVTGIEQDPAAAAEARTWCLRVVEGDADDPELALPDGPFDVVLCGDVLEHLRDPSAFLRRLAAAYPGAKLVASIPNIANWRTRASLFIGRWNYADEGLLDRTHLRFYTRRTSEALLKEGGWIVEDIQPSTGFPVVLALGSRRVAHGLTRAWPTLFALQFVYTATTAAVAGGAESGA